MNSMSLISRANRTLAVIGLIVIVAVLIWIFVEGVCLGGAVC
jgi:hypothetical protein